MHWSTYVRDEAVSKWWVTIKSGYDEPVHYLNRWQLRDSKEKQSLVNTNFKQVDQSKTLKVISTLSQAPSHLSI